MSREASTNVPTTVVTNTTVIVCRPRSRASSSSSSNDGYSSDGIRDPPPGNVRESTLESSVYEVPSQPLYNILEGTERKKVISCVLSILKRKSQVKQLLGAVSLDRQKTRATLSKTDQESGN